MIRKPIRITEAGVLRVRFTDGALEPFQASGVQVNLYSPDLDPTIDPPTVSSLTPVYLGDGVFELTLTAQEPAGLWTDEWIGQILGTTTIARFHFEVAGAGGASLYPVFGVCQNNLVEVTLSSGVKALDGSVLSTEYSFFFTTEYCPLYADVRKVRLESGGLLGNVPDYTLYNALLEASLEADAITFALTTVNGKLFQHARREYVACKAGMIIGSNLLATGGVLKSKRLADFQVEYDRGSLENLLDQLHANCKRWQNQIETGGGARALRDPQFVIKGELDPDRPNFGRNWLEVDRGQLPIGNTRVQPRGSRRHKTTYQTPKSRKKTWEDW